MRTRHARAAARQKLLAQLGCDLWGVVSEFLVENAVHRLETNDANGLEAHLSACEDDTLPDLERTQFSKEIRPVTERARLLQLRDFRTVCRAFRNSVSYATLRQLRLSPRWFSGLPADFGTTFPGCESLVVYGHGKPVLDEGTVPSVFRDLPRLRALMFTVYKVSFPPWFRDIPLETLVMGYRSSDYKDCPWEIDERVFPESLRVLRHSACTDLHSLEHVRRLSLREIEIGPYHVSPPNWFIADMGQLRRFWSYMNYLPAWASTLRQMRLESVTFDIDDPGILLSEFEVALEEMVGPGSTCGMTIRELDVHGQRMHRVPESLRPLRLRFLNLGMCGLTELPDFLGELPLVVLNVSANESLRALPVSLRQVSTLRVLHLNWTSLASPFICGFRERTAHLLVDGQKTSLGDVPNEEILRRNHELYSISFALPELRIVLGGVCERADQEQVWWHARCGAHWADPSFVS